MTRPGFSPGCEGVRLPWREVAARWNQRSGERITYQACQQIADKAVRKLRIELEVSGLGREMFHNLPGQAKDLSQGVVS